MHYRLSPKANNMNNIPRYSSFSEKADKMNYVGLVKNFEVFLTDVLSESSDVKLINFIEDYFGKLPLTRRILLQFYKHLTHELGSPKIAKEVARIHCETSSRLLEIGMNDLGLPPIFDCSWTLGNTGEIAEHTAFIARQNQLNQTTLKPVLCLPKKGLKDIFGNPITIANPSFIPYLNDYFEIITDDDECTLFEKYVSSSPFSSIFFKNTDTNYGYVSDFFATTYTSALKKGTIEPPFALKQDTIEKAQNFLTSFGLDKKDEFVLIYTQSETCKSGFRHDQQSVETSHYSAAIKWFLKQGIKVVKIGSPSTEEVLKFPGFIDLTQITAPGEIEIFLCGAAKFYLGSGSGPFYLANQFGTPCALTALLPYGPQRAGNFLQFQKLRDTQSQKTLSYDEVLDRRLGLVFSKKAFNRAGVAIIKSTSEEILNFAKEAINYFEHGEIFRKNKSVEAKLASLRIYSGVCSESHSLLAS